MTPSSAVSPRNEESRFDKKIGVKNNPYNEIASPKNLASTLRMGRYLLSYDVEGEDMVGLKS